MRKLYIIYDRIANEPVGMRMYTVMSFRTNEEATRYFADAILDQSSILAKHPADYELQFVGLMNELGYITAEKDPRLIITGDALLSIHKDATDKVALETSTPR